MGETDNKALMTLPSPPLEKAPRHYAIRWARGETTLQDIKGYSEEELHQIAQQGYTLFLNGKIRDARVVFEGLVAIDPRNAYYYRALGVVYHRQGDAERALRQFGHAITVAPDQPEAFVNRAEVHIARRDFFRAGADLDRAIAVGHPRAPVVRKAHALRTLIQGRDAAIIR